jgi:anaerobic magnesium-protoporphyrin IX monomethyl ester cyclase
MTGRGCGWGVCTFCSDVVTGAGRGFRSRSPGNVLEEMKVQAGRHGAGVFTFLDLKLNSDLSVWHGLADGAQDAVPGCQWSASLHVGIKGNDGLGLAELKAARAGGLVRLTTGLESGSDRMLKAMAKGTSAEMLSRFVRHAHEAGISVRLTAITGYPGETPDDVLATERFLRAHLAHVDRIVLNRFSIQLGTPFQRQLAGTPSRFPEITDLVFDPLTACFEHVNQTFLTPAHRRAMLGLLAAVHAINRKPLNNASATFEGVM